ncbi:unnamed protein product [Clonostachys rosea f. rosea IK726]|jgi:hypothetical protein|uniref:Uncharacterized protein n=1 Tax=Clonostachys rosea f. rosea IK726 TaxID=1349383 RepID=A0ACA9TCG0_BIOOC|nr:unnamed protein product [Clonostachys rosea f. rosea IK726]
MTPPLCLTIRFSNSLPDLNLDIPSPESTTILGLKRLLRSKIDSRNGLRLIYQGRLLADSSALSSVLKPPLQPPPTPNQDHHDPKGKGKAKAEDDALSPPLRIYVICSIADDELSQPELDAEAAAADLPPALDQDALSGSAQPKPSTRPRPQGFDRLLASGFTSSEVSTLRTQFASIHADHYPPDAPPSPDTLRGLEDSWIDSSAFGQGLATTAGGREDAWGLGQAVDDIFISAMMIGFFWPLGSLTWLLRQEGLWNDKWRIFIVAGAVLSLLVGTIVSISGGRP